MDNNSTNDQVLRPGRSMLQKSLGIRDIEGSISKEVEFCGGIPVSTLSISLHNVMPEDLDYIFSRIRKEAEGVLGDMDHAVFCRDERLRQSDELLATRKEQYREEAKKAWGYS